MHIAINQMSMELKRQIVTWLYFVKKHSTLDSANTALAHMMDHMQCAMYTMGTIVICT